MQTNAGSDRNVIPFVLNILASQFPGLQKSLHYLPLTNLPTPLDAAPQLAHHMGLDQIWIKRDDLSADIYGGNKVRKLEYLIGDALHRGCDAVITFGAIGSNHALATSIFARQQGLPCYAVLMDQAMTPYIGRTLKYHARIGTVLLHAENFKQAQQLANEIIANHPTGPDQICHVTWGGSSWLGTVGFVNAALELANQLQADDLPEKIYLASGSIGTSVGLALGLRLANLPTKVVAVRVVPAPANDDRFIYLFEETNRELHDRDHSFPIFEDAMANVETRYEFLGPAYAEPTAESLEAIDLISSTEGLKLENTYTGKALAALLKDARDAGRAGGKPLFWHTYNGRSYPDDLDSIEADEFPEPFRRYL